MGRKPKFEQIDFEINFYERLLEKKPDFVEAIEALADVYTKRGIFEKGLRLDEKLKKIKPLDPIVYYNLACSYSLLNEIDKSFDTLKRAIGLGYDNLRFLQLDPDLSNLRQDARFKGFIHDVTSQKDKKYESK